ncbi:class I SAM-dependent methyltransferase, partial [Acidobacteriota bacterium]
TGPLEDWRYAGFENRYRGSVEEIKEQLSQYLEYFSAGARVLDLGCGRGEFVELLVNKGLDAEGVDLNEQMIEICREKGLNCRKADILETLAGCEDGFLGGIFSSQVIEHLPPEYLKRMVELAYFKLAPSGHIVLETVNPTSVFTLVQIYYLDMSHQMPIHPRALKYLMESVGFENVEIKYSAPLGDERLRDLPSEDEHSVVLNQNIDKLNDLLFAPSNFAVIGRKK